MGAAASFPGDENGDVLRCMLKNSDDLSVARNIDFKHVFASSSFALNFVVAVLNQSDSSTINWYEVESCWKVHVARYMRADARNHHCT